MFDCPNIISVGKIILDYVWVLARTLRMFLFLVIRIFLLSFYGISE